MSLKLVLNTLLTISILIVLLNDFILSDVEELFKYGDELGQVLSNLSLAYISSHIFYYLIIVLKENRDKKLIHVTVYHLTKQMTGRASIVLSVINSASKENINLFNITFDKLQEMCLKTNPHDICPDRGVRDRTSNTIKLEATNTNGEVIYNSAVTNVQIYSDKIFRYLPYLDAEYIHLLNEITESRFHLTNAEFLIMPIFTNTDLSTLVEPIYQFLERIRTLHNYNETIIKPMLKRIEKSN